MDDRSTGVVSRPGRAGRPALLGRGALDRRAPHGPAAGLDALVAAVSWGLDPQGVGGHGEVASRNTAGSTARESMVAWNASEFGACSRSSM